MTPIQDVRQGEGREMACPTCKVERADYEGPNGAWLAECPNCGSDADPAPSADLEREFWLVTTENRCGMTRFTEAVDCSPAEVLRVHRDNGFPRTLIFAMRISEADFKTLEDQ